MKQKDGSELRNKTLASLKPEISQALGSLLDELRSIEDTKAMRIGSTTPRSHPNSGRGRPRRRPFLSRILCKTTGRPHNTHKMMDCRYLPDRDRRPWARSRMVMADPDDPGGEECEPLDESSDLVVPPVQSGEPAALRVSIVQSPVLHTFYHQHPVQLTLDTGATSNMVRASPAQPYGFPITPASQMARQADGVTPMDVIGEVHCSLTRGQWTFELHDLVVRQLDVDILANNPFMARNDNGVRPAKRQIEIDCPSNTQRKPDDVWPPPQQIQSVDHAVRVSNTTDSPILLKRGEHLCQVPHILPVEASISTSPPNTCGAVSSSPAICKPFSSRVILDPDGCLDQDTREKFKALNLEFDDVFNPSISKYNGASGKVEAVVNSGSTPPPQRKGRLPQYNSNTLEELQAKFDELEAAGVFAKPEQVNVHVEYLNTSSLFKQPNGGSRLVTSFGEVAQYSKPQASLMPNVHGVVREIGLGLT